MRTGAVGGVVVAMAMALACQDPAPTPSQPAPAPDVVPPTSAAPPSVDALDPAAPRTTAADPRPSEPLPPTSPPDRPSTLTLAFVGDVVLGEYVFDEHRSFAGPDAPHDPFAPVADLLHADLLVGNLESPVVQQVPVPSPLRFGRRFGGSASAVDALTAAGFDVMSVANNHANDLGRAGLEQTPSILHARGLLAPGAARPEGSPFAVETLEHDGWRVGFLSAATWLNHEPDPGDPTIPLVRTGDAAAVLVPRLREARPEHDLLVVLLHWGREGRETPGFVQIHTAHALVDAGADLVIGHHPHVLQGIERYEGGIIAYSLGNFLFPARRHEFRDTGLLRVQWDMQARCPAEVTFEALHLDRTLGHGPRPATPRERRAILDRIQRLGVGLGTRWRQRGDAMVLHEPRPRAAR